MLIPKLRKTANGSLQQWNRNLPISSSLNNPSTLLLPHHILQAWPLTAPAGSSRPNTTSVSSKPKTKEKNRRPSSRSSNCSILAKMERSWLRKHFIIRCCWQRRGWFMSARKKVMGVSRSVYFSLGLVFAGGGNIWILSGFGVTFFCSWLILMRCNLV